MLRCTEVRATYIRLSIIPDDFGGFYNECGNGHRWWVDVPGDYTIPLSCEVRKAGSLNWTSARNVQVGEDVTDIFTPIRACTRCIRIAGYGGNPKSRCRCNKHRDV